jgi:hypothetical protein
MLGFMWVVEKIEISGGFLPGLSVDIPPGLTCIIGARGSGKSTLAEAVRFALCGISAAPKHCADLIQANLAGGALVTITALADGSNHYTIKRGLKQNPVLLTSDGRAINTVDLDRGTFLPLDAYSSLEIEAIADEALGHKTAESAGRTSYGTGARNPPVARRECARARNQCGPHPDGQAKYRRLDGAD